MRYSHKKLFTTLLYTLWSLKFILSQYPLYNIPLIYKVHGQKKLFMMDIRKYQHYIDRDFSSIYFYTVLRAEIGTAKFSRKQRFMCVGLFLLTQLSSYTLSLPQPHPGNHQLALSSEMLSLAVTPWGEAMLIRLNF